jgi:hypothetical protein
VLDATFCLPIGDGQPVVGRAGKGTLEMINLTRSRKLIVCLLCGARLILAGLLLFYGGAFLAHTLEIDELILNGGYRAVTINIWCAGNIWCAIFKRYITHHNTLLV